MLDLRRRETVARPQLEGIRVIVRGDLDEPDDQQTRRREKALHAAHSRISSGGLQRPMLRLGHMRQAVSILLIAVIGLAWANVLTAGNSMPPCCKAHHCTMKKQCAISSCDGSTTASVSAKTFTILCDVFELLPVATSSPTAPLAARRPPLAQSGNIDHPPRLLLF
jgi:hypothetical protein